MEREGGLTSTEHGQKLRSCFATGRAERPPYRATPTARDLRGLSLKHRPLLIMSATMTNPTGAPEPARRETAPLKHVAFELMKPCAPVMRSAARLLDLQAARLCSKKSPVASSHNPPVP